MTIYEASIQPLSATSISPQRIYTTNARDAARKIRMLVREFAPMIKGGYEARVMRTDSAGWMTFEVERLA